MNMSIWHTIGGKELPTDSEVYSECHKIYPSTRAPKKPTILYERDEEEIIYDWMKSRAYLLEQSYAISTLLSISIVPMHPSIRQTWFQSNIAKPVALGERPSYFTSKNQISQKPASEETARVNGFVKPYHGFSSDLGIPDRRFDTIVPILISSNQDIALSLSEIIDEKLRSKLQFLLSIFLDDNEAHSIALRFHSQESAFLKIFQKA